MKIKSLFLITILFLTVQLSTAQVARTNAQSAFSKEEAANWVVVHEAKLQQTIDSSERHHQLIYLTPAAFAAGETEKAQAFAKELLNLGEKLKSQPGFGPSLYGQATYTANIVLGHIALDENDIEMAKQHLLSAARIPGSSVLKSFGPDMLLAKQLIEKGERQTALEYFDLCAKFWKRSDGRLEQWKVIVEQGKTPDFGFSLRAGLDTWRVVP